MHIFEKAYTSLTTSGCASHQSRNASQSAISRSSVISATCAGQPFPAIEAVYTIVPPLVIRSISPSVSRRDAATLTAIQVRTPALAATPAFENTTSIGSSSCAIAASIDAGSARLASMNVSHRPVGALMSRMVRCSTPSSPSSSARAAPIPVAPPVRTTRLPE